MGLEHKTLVYYIISGVFMLLSIWFLPSVIGIYSLLVGFSFIYGLTTLLNLILLHKNCDKKPKYLKFLIFSALLVIPTVLFGLMIEKLLLPVLGTFLTFTICSVAMMIFNAFLFVGFNLISIDFIKSKLKLKPRKYILGKTKN